MLRNLNKKGYFITLYPKRLFIPIMSFASFYQTHSFSLKKLLLQRKSINVCVFFAWVKKATVTS